MPDDQSNRVSGMQLDVIGRRVWIDGVLQPMLLTKTELKFLLVLARNSSKHCSREEIVLAVYTSTYAPKVDDERIDALVGRIRRKIEDNPRNPRFLRTIYRVGHCLEGYIGERKDPS